MHGQAGHKAGYELVIDLSIHPSIHPSIWTGQPATNGFKMASAG